MGLAAFGPRLGLDLGPAEATALVQDLGTLVGLALAIWGRLTAKTGVRAV